ncbi:hypothetical protein [Coxiella-like endosymbiont]|uniref:hypothetical protein n=1 Tax=Coxiella-like endosymbiont TaxID=1592897 RepID=UPI00272CE1B9|nr:hypothetical protein [Coxiella-like endosymbiont]
MFREMYYQCNQKCSINLSFGTTVMLATMISVVNFFVMLAAVMGATLLYIEIYGNDIWKWLIFLDKFPLI